MTDNHEEHYWEHDPHNEVHEDDLIANSIHEDVMRAEQVSEDFIQANEITESDLEVTSFAAPAESEDKPAFGIWKYGKFGKSDDVLATQSSGPQVAYINKKFNIQGDEFTDETKSSVFKYQKQNGLRPSGRVDKRTYDAL